MQIYTATADFFMYVSRMFRDLGEVKILPTESRKNYKSLDIDLLVLTGGEDISPEYYGIRKPHNYFNDIRDSTEYGIMTDAIAGEFKSLKKVLGICRGMQMINIGFGGNLVQDIYSRYGIEHASTHRLEHAKTSDLKFLEVVNSLHHQGLDTIGSTKKYPYQVLASEPETRLPEIVKWGDRFMGVQFHPEMFPDANPVKKEFVNYIKNWVTNSNSIVSLLGLSRDKAVPETPF